jgi:hypothetical protein
VLNEHFAGTYDAFLVLTHADGGSLAAFVRHGRELLSSTADPVAGEPRGTLDAPSDDVGQYYGNLIASLDDALFEAENPATIDTLSQLMEMAEAAQLASKYFQNPEILERIADIQEALHQSGLVGKANGQRPGGCSGSAAVSVLTPPAGSVAYGYAGLQFDRCLAATEEWGQSGHD